MTGRLQACVRKLAFAATVLAAALSPAAVKPAAVFADHAVLQRDRPLRVWGTADAGERVTVAFAGQSVAADADAQGRWLVTLKPVPASAEPATMTLSGKGNTVTVGDLLVGDVWLCSGQSNMSFKVSQAKDAGKEIAAADHPLIRHFVAKISAAHKPAYDNKGAWAVCSPATVGNFTAVGYFFARDVQPQIGVPVGLLHASLGGTLIEAWMPPEAYERVPKIQFVTDRWSKLLDDYPALKKQHAADVAEWQRKVDEGKASGKPYTRPRPRDPAFRGGPASVDQPSGLYDGMIAPLRQYAVRGVLWYQGEQNVNRAGEYRALMETLIPQWRTALGDDALPFFWVQLANFGWGKAGDINMARLREAQDQCLALPHTGQALAIDLGESKDIHPTNKQEVGRRLMLLAMNRVYGRPMADEGPTIKSVDFDGNSASAHFCRCITLRPVEGRVAEFELAGEDRKFFPADATIQDDTVVVRSAKVAKPVALRYAWRNDVAVNLYDTNGLPAAPYRTDDW